MRKEVIGNCELYCGDCLEILPTLDKVDAVITDPPYGMNYVSNYRKVKSDLIINDDNTVITNRVIYWAIHNAIQASYVFGRWENILIYPKPKSVVVWVKNNWSMGDLQHEHARQTELIFFYSGHNHKWKQSRPTDVIYNARSGNVYHPTEKPVGLMKNIIDLSYANTILDPFMGSGTTGVACVETGRRFIGIELNEKYFDIACKRIEEASRQGTLDFEKAG